MIKNKDEFLEDFLYSRLSMIGPNVISEKKVKNIIKLGNIAYDEIVKCSCKNIKMED